SEESAARESLCRPVEGWRRRNPLSSASPSGPGQRDAGSPGLLGGSLRGPDVGQVEVVPPLPSVGGGFPGAGDRCAVLGDHSGVALPESGCLAPELPLSALKGHLVDAGDAARVVVVLDECVPSLARTDERNAAGGGGMLIGEVLREEEPAFKPLEGRPAAAFDLGADWAEESGLERGLHLPLADQDIEAIQRHRPFARDVAWAVRCHLLVTVLRLLGARHRGSFRAAEHAFWR